MSDNLSRAQQDLLEYLDGCEWATPRTILRVKKHTRGTINALIRRGLVEVRRSSVSGYECIYIAREK